MSKIDVTFDVPEEILKGLHDGTLERVGGVVRDVDDKTVYAWLVETGSKLENSSIDPTGAISQILSQQQMMMGLQVANLAVNVAGFALICHKLNRVEGQLKHIDQNLTEIRDEQSWMQKKQLFSQLSPLLASLQTLQGLQEIESKRVAEKKLLSADDQLSGAQIYFHKTLQQMLEDQLEYQYSEEFSVSYRAWIVAGSAAIQAMAELGEIGEAVARCERLTQEHAEFGNQWRGILGDHLRSLEEKTRGHASRQILTDLSEQVAGAHQILRGKRLQLECMREKSIPLADINSGALEKDGRIAICIPTV